MKDLRSNKEGIEHAVLDVELTMKESKFHAHQIRISEILLWDR